ncbi:phage tail protein [Clostridium botulinum]|nr:phage tail protein [Clostridium botulinum]NFI17332.1 phage tail protein [Clostridium botulinum]NFL92091.1 phage tail protein [Clostridium botulinum]NFN52135.1 phage tail protein [Clostridium botulinum]NFO26652.1 phage tail protein [Clostridium botulinum]
MVNVKGLKYYTILTNIGQAKIANSLYTGEKIDFATLKLGDGNGTMCYPTPEQTDVVHEVWSGTITHVEIDEENPNWMNAYVLIPPKDGGFYIREMAMFDSEGDMLAIANCAESYKPVIDECSAKEITMKMTVAIVNTSTVTLKIDPAVIYAKRKELQILSNKVNDLAEQMKDIANKVDNIKIADGTTTTKGIVKLNNATNSTSQAEAATPLAVKTAMDKANEAFQYASNGKSLIAGKVGNVTGSNTHTEIANRIQTDKNTAATNLSNKGVSANGNEALATLASKIENISIEGMGGKKFATGKVKGSLNEVTKEFREINTNLTDRTVFESATGTHRLATNEFNFLQINLSFKPKHIFAYNTSGYFSCATDNWAVFGASTVPGFRANAYISGAILEGNTMYLPITISSGAEFDYIAYD